MIGLLLAAVATAEYVLISPPKYFEAWKGYVEMREKGHGDVSFSITNSFDVYDAYPFPGWVKDGRAMKPACSNAAESIYHYIRDRWNPDKRQYYVLGGPWINGGTDYNDDGDTIVKRVIYIRTTGGELLSLTNAIPGVKVHTGGDFYGDTPSDCFFACLGDPESEPDRHPWYDAESDAYFPPSMTSDIVDAVPDVVVSRMPFMPWTNAVGQALSVAACISNYAEKVRQAEADVFPGRHRYALLSAPYVRERLTNLKNVMDGNAPHRFFDAYPEYYDGAHSRDISDVEIGLRFRLRRWIMPHSPLRRGLIAIRPEPFTPKSDVNVDEFFSGDWEMALAKSHGEPDCLVDTGITRDRFLAMTNLCKILMFPMPCNTGWPDWYPYGDERWSEDYRTVTNVFNLSLAAAAIQNPNGGGVVGIHNSRPGYSEDRATAVDVANCADGMSSAIEGYMLEKVFSDRVTVGEAWMRGIERYVCSGQALSGKSIVVALQEMLYGDPLIAITPCEASADESVVRWDVSGDRELPPVWRVTDTATVTNGDLSTSGRGGINRLEFSGRKGDLTLAGDGEFFVNAVTNGGTLAISGCNKHIRLESCDITNLVLSATGDAVLTNELSVSASARLAKLEIKIDGNVILRATGTNVYSVAQGVHVSGAGYLTIPNVGLFGPNVTADPAVKLEYDPGKRKGIIFIFR